MRAEHPSPIPSSFREPIRRASSVEAWLKYRSTRPSRRRVPGVSSAARKLPASGAFRKTGSRQESRDIPPFDKDTVTQRTFQTAPGTIGCPNRRPQPPAPTTSPDRDPQPPSPSRQPQPPSRPGQVHPTARSKLFPRPRIKPFLPALPPEVPHAEPNWNHQRLLHSRSPEHTATPARSKSCAARPRQKPRPSGRGIPSSIRRKPLSLDSLRTVTALGMSVC